tara:strand:- start:387 stop:608 length:222 start_codon:yes stop_codon:yes gene_type:complete
MTDKIDIVDKLSNLVHISAINDAEWVVQYQLLIMGEAREEIERLREKVKKYETQAMEMNPMVDDPWSFGKEDV